MEASTSNTFAIDKLFKIFFMMIFSATPVIKPKRNSSLQLGSLQMGLLGSPPGLYALVGLLCQFEIVSNKERKFTLMVLAILLYTIILQQDLIKIIIQVKGENPSGKQDYFHEEQTGDLYSHGKRICNSGIQILKNSHIFQSKSVQALEKGAILPTKFHYLAFNSKNGNHLIKNLFFPFAFYQKHKVFCTPVTTTRANINVLVETEAKNPIVFTHGNCLSTHLLCTEISKIVANWITEGQQIKPFRQIIIENEAVPDVAFDNLISLSNTKMTKNYTKSSLTNLLESNKNSIKRPHTASSSKSKYTFEKPIVRCSSPYDTVEHIKLLQEQNNKYKLLGRSRMNFKSEMYKNQIQNYVQRTPSRPPSAHQFRDINKARWMDKKNFFVT